MFLAMLLLPGWTEPPKAAELTPVPKVEPKPTDPLPVEVNKYRVYSVQNHTGPVTWQTEGESIGIKEADKPLTLFGVVSGQTDPTETPVPVGAVVIWGKAPGMTKVSAWGVVDGKAKLLLTLLFQVGPRPPPEPQPQPLPTPVAGKAFGAIIVEDPNEYIENRGQYLLAFNNWCDSHGVNRRWVPNNVRDSSGKPPADMVPYLTRAFGKKQPYLTIVTEKGGVLYEGSPATPEELTETLNKYKGK